MREENIKFLILQILNIITTIIFFVLSGIIIIKNNNKENIISVFSKIETIEEILNLDRDKYPILNLTENLNHIYLYKNYKYLLNHSTKNTCEDEFKKCGILDSYGNIMCLEKDIPCPINEIIIDNKNKKIEYYNLGFHSLEIDETRNIYYTNNSIGKEIITEFKYSEEKPKLITEENLLIDEYIYKKLYSNDDGDELIKNVDLEKLKEKILNKINNEDNINPFFKNISNNYYIKNYIGYGNYSQMNKFFNFNKYVFFNYRYYKSLKIYYIVYICLIIVYKICVLFIIAFDNKVGNEICFTFIFLLYGIIAMVIINKIYSFYNDNIIFLIEFEYLLKKILKDYLLIFQFKGLTVLCSHFLSLTFMLGFLYYCLRFIYR